MEEQEIPENFSISGLLKRIVSYKTHHNSTTVPSGHPLMDTGITTNLEILADDGKTIPINFYAYVGSELINQKVTYITSGAVTTGDVSTAAGVNAQQKVTIQSLIPEDYSLPTYLVSNCVYRG